MRSLIALLIVALSVPAWSASQPEGCGALCGRWVLDRTRSDSAEDLLDAALASYREPRPRREPTRRAAPDDAAAAVREDMERSIGPVLDRPRSAGLRAELLPRVMPPPDLNFEIQGRTLMIRMSDQPDRRLSVGASRTRVDEVGTARIDTTWRSGTLTVSERYDRRHSQTETFAVQRDGTLLVTQVLQRPGLQNVRVRAVYQRD